MKKTTFSLIIALSLLTSAAYADKKAEKQTVCHYTDNHQLVVLSLPQKAFQVHMDHGDELPGTYYEDADSDGFGNPEVSTVACEMPSGFIEDNTDLDDTDASIGGADIYKLVWKYYISGYTLVLKFKSDFNYFYPDGIVLNNLDVVTTEQGKKMKVDMYGGSGTHLLQFKKIDSISDGDSFQVLIKNETIERLVTVTIIDTKW